MVPFSCLFLVFFQAVIFENVSATGILLRTDYLSECNFQDDFILKQSELQYGNLNCPNDNSFLI